MKDSTSQELSIKSALLLHFVVVRYQLILAHTCQDSFSGTWAINFKIVLVPVNQPWMKWVNESYELQRTAQITYKVSENCMIFHSITSWLKQLWFLHLCWLSPSTFHRKHSVAVITTHCDLMILRDIMRLGFIGSSNDIFPDTIKPLPGPLPVNSHQHNPLNFNSK